MAKIVNNLNFGMVWLMANSCDLEVENLSLVGIVLRIVLIVAMREDSQRLSLKNGWKWLWH